MRSNNKILNILVLFTIVILQYVLALVCVFFFPGLGSSFLELAPLANPILGHLSLLVAYSIGIFIMGWLGLLLIRRQVKKKLLLRFTWMVLAIAIPLSIALIPGVESDDVFYLIAILAGILGFYLPEATRR